MLRKSFLFFFSVLFTPRLLIAQQFEAHSTNYIDFTSNQNRIEETRFEFDTSSFFMQMGEMNLYFGVAVCKKLTSGLQYKLLDKNDDTVLVTFNQRTKYIDYRLNNYYLRFILDKIKEIKPLDTGTLAPLIDSMGNEIVEEDTVIYEEADVMPEYPEGKGAMTAFFSANIKIPKEAIKNNIHGFVKILAVVEKDGTLSNVMIKSDCGYGCGNEAVRVVKLMPAWSPGEIDGVPKRVVVEFLVPFMK